MSRTVLRALRSRHYLLFWSGSFVANVGVWMQQIALGWLVYEMTRSASLLGTMSFCANLPVLVLGLVGGAIVDRASRRAVIVGAQTVFALAALALAVLTFSGRLAYWHVVAIAMCAGTALAVHQPAMQAVIPTLVEPEDLLNAISLNSVQFNLARTLGPALAGMLYARIGAAGCFALNAVGFVLLTIVLARIPMARKPAGAPPPMAHALREGLGYARAHPVIGPALFLAAMTSLFGFPYIILLPALAREALGLDATGLGYLMASVGAGAVVGGLALSAVGDVPYKGLVSIGSAFGFSLVLASFAVVRTAHATMAVLFTLGALQTVCVSSLVTTIQIAVDDAMRGRIMSMMTVVLFGFSTVGSLVVGTAGDHVGVPYAIACGGLVVALAATAVLARAPGLPRALRPVGA